MKGFSSQSWLEKEIVPVLVPWVEGRNLTVKLVVAPAANGLLGWLMILKSPEPVTVPMVVDEFPVFRMV